MLRALNVQNKKWSGILTPKIRDKLRKNTEFSRDVGVSPATGGVFGVESHGRDYVVEIKLKACSCRRWQLAGIPCSHAIAYMRHERIKTESMVSSCYSLSTYMEAYGGQIYPLRDKEEWAAADGAPIPPPIYDKCVERRKKNRRKQPEESADGTRLSKHGAIMHCGYCREPGHNRGGCKLLKAAIQQEKEIAQEEKQAHQPQMYEEKQAQQPQMHEGKHAHQPPMHEEKQAQPAHGLREEGKSTSSRGRKRKESTKMKEHVENLMEKARRKKSKQVTDENGDIDFPVIRTHIHAQPVRPHLDPEQQTEFMVHILAHEETTQGNHAILEEMPEESHFVAEHRDTIPTARGPLINTSGRALGGGRQATTARGGRQATTTRGARQTTIVRDARQATIATPRWQSTTGTRRRGARWLLLGEEPRTRRRRGATSHQVVED